MSELGNRMDIAVHRVNSVDGNYGMALKYHTYTVYTGYKVFFPKICSSKINLMCTSAQNVQ